MLKIAWVIALGLFALAIPSTGIARAASPATVYIVHGINGQDLGLASALPVDVSVDGACALRGLTFKQVAGPVALPAGPHTVAVAPANATNPCGNAPVIGPATLTFVAGTTYSVVAHLTATGKPTASQFVDDVSAVQDDNARLGLYHTAFAPAVDVLLSRGHRSITVPNVVNGQGATAVLKAGPWTVAVNLAGTRTTVLGPAALRLASQTATFGYVVGSATNGLSLVSVTISTSQDEDGNNDGDYQHHGDGGYGHGGEGDD